MWRSARHVSKSLGVTHQSEGIEGPTVLWVVSGCLTGVMSRDGLREGFRGGEEDADEGWSFLSDIHH